MTNPARRAKSRKNSMWQEESEATNASSGSTPAGSDQGAGTMCGLALAVMTWPPSDAHSCARLYWPLVKPSAPLRLQRMVAGEVLISRPQGADTWVKRAPNGTASAFTVVRNQKMRGCTLRMTGLG